MPNAIAIWRDDRASQADMQLSSEQISTVLGELRRICRDSSLDVALRIGALIIHHIYAGDFSVWRTRGRKSTSFRQLARHPELPMSAGALYRCVALFELCERFDATSRWRRLGASQFRVVVGLAPALQEKLLDEANAKRWSVQTLARQARAHRCGARPRGGRRPSAPVVKNLKAAFEELERFSERLRETDELPGEQVHRLREAMRQIEAGVTEFSAMLASYRESRGGVVVAGSVVSVQPLCIATAHLVR